MILSGPKDKSDEDIEKDIDDIIEEADEKANEMFPDPE